MITTHMRGHLIRTDNEACRVPINIDLVWNDRDPVAFEMVFHRGGGQSTTWVASYEMLVDAMTCLVPVGDGDVQFRRDLNNILFVRVKSPAGSAGFALPTEPVTDFLDQSANDVEAAASKIPSQIDDALKEILDAN